MAKYTARNCPTLRAIRRVANDRIYARCVDIRNAEGATWAARHAAEMLVRRERVDEAAAAFVAGRVPYPFAPR